MLEEARFPHPQRSRDQDRTNLASVGQRSSKKGNLVFSSDNPGFHWFMMWCAGFASRSLPVPAKDTGRVNDGPEIRSSNFDTGEFQEAENDFHAQVRLGQGGRSGLILEAILGVV